VLVNMLSPFESTPPARLLADGTEDTAFDPAPYAGADVVVQPDGKILVGRNPIVRFNADGTPDAGFIAPSLPGREVKRLMLGADGKVTVYTVQNGYGGFVRLNPNGSRDTGFNYDANGGYQGANGMINALAVQSDQRVLIGGRFTRVNGILQNGIARLEPDGSLDTSFTRGSGLLDSDGSSGTVYSIALQSDGKILIGGSWRDSYDGQGSLDFDRLNADGTLDMSFRGQALGPVNSIFVQGDKKILIGGYFQGMFSAAGRNVARCNADGSIDFSFVPADTGLTEVLAVAAQADGGVLAGGYGGRALVRLNANGSVDSTFSPVLADSASTSARVYAIKVLGDGRILVGGSFTHVNGAARNGLAWLNPGGTLNTTLAQGLPAGSGVRALAIESTTSKILAANGRRVYRLNTTGTLDTSFDAGLGGNDTIQSVAERNGAVVVGGWFDQFNGAARGYVARLDGSSLPGLSILDTVVVEGTADHSSCTTDKAPPTVFAAFPVVLREASSTTVTVNWQTVNGTATGIPATDCVPSSAAKGDFVQLKGSLTFAPGVRTQVIMIPIMSDFVFEDNHDFSVQLSNPVGARLLDPVGVCTIKDDDPKIGITEGIPQQGVAAVGQEGVYSVRWTHPTRWRLLNTIDVRLMDGDQAVLWVRFDETDGTFSQYNPHSDKYHSPSLPGSNRVYAGNQVQMLLKGSSAVGSGPTGPSVDLNLDFIFGPNAAGHVFRVEAFAEDDFGQQQGFEPVGTIEVER